jgi:hypothetical protein
MVQPLSKLDSFPSDGIPPFKYALSATAVDIGRSEVMNALVVTPGVAMSRWKWELERRDGGPPRAILVESR